MAEVTAWQARPLELMYPVVFFDALRVKIRENAVVRNKAIYLALGVLPDGTRDILGLWIESTEGAKFWMKVFNDLKTRGVNDILIAVTDGLNGMPEALAAVFPATTLQTCIVHLMRNSLDYARWKDRRGLAAAINLHGGERGSGPGRVGCVCRQRMGTALPDRQCLMAQRLGSRDPVLRISPGDSQDHQDARSLSQ